MNSIDVSINNENKDKSIKGECFNTEEFFMKEALKEAKKAYSLKETPIGAVIVYNGEIVGRGYNQIETTQNPVNHAEIMAIQDACRNLDRWRLFDCEMYITMEPCVMCAGAIVNSRIKKLYVGARHMKNHVVDKHNRYKIEIYNDSKVEFKFGILEEECSNLLTNFFKEKRNK